MTRTNFSQLIGQTQAIELLNQVVELDRLAPAYLFTGPDGVGRSLAAHYFIELIFSQKAKAKSDQHSLKNRIEKRNHPDLLWVEPTYLHQGKLLSATAAAEAGVKRKAPPQIRLEQIREVSQFLSRAPLETSRTVVVLEQAETMAESAANGLLKTLEEPGKATLILIAVSIESLLPTLVSRCQRIPFYRLSSEAISQVLNVTGNQKILAHQEIMAMAQGSPGEAIACWQQLEVIPPELLGKLKQKPTNLRQVLELAKEIDQKLDTESQLWVIEYLQQFYWQTSAKSVGLEIKPIITSLEKARKYLLSYVQPRLVWECTLMAMLTAS